MRTIERSSEFKRDRKHIKANPRNRDLDSVLLPILTLLVADESLAESNRDHPLSGDWVGYWECHI